jgi:hypothetical protein
MRIQDKPFRASAVGLLLVLAALGAAAQETNSLPPDKAGYSLFNPVPKNLMRELNSDRPDETESPFTVDAGHYQLEMDFANYAYNQSDGMTTKAWNVAPFNLRIGLLNQVELNLIFDNYLHVRTDDRLARTSTTQSGIGDLTTRLKINLWGDDGGKTAFALLPFVKIPTSTDGLGNSAVECGVIFPLAVKLPADFDLGLESAVSCLRDNSDSNYHADFINSITLDHGIIGKLSGYVEFYSEISSEPQSAWIGTVDVGLEYLLSKNVQLDCGCNFGVTRAADNFNPFAGITVKF